VTRLGDEIFDQDDLGEVRFVPLIGAHGWAVGAGSDALVEPKPKPADGPMQVKRVNPSRPDS